MASNLKLKYVDEPTEAASPLRPAEPEILWLREFLPYRMAVVAGRMLRESGRMYKRRRNPLTTPQWRIIGILANFEPLVASEISKISMLDKVAVSRALTQLARRGFVARKRVRRDKRALEVTLTKEGWRYYRLLIPSLKQQEQEMRAVLAPGDVDRLFGMLARFDAVFAELDARRATYRDDIEVGDIVRRRRSIGLG
ncbi:MAG: MarR family winged helix-turn-helix transcriptional regulator [Alphaproteobacteria bacterium]